jgi:hypothetical protein
VLAAVCTLFPTLAPAYAADVSVNCDGKKNKKTIQSVLDSLSKQGPHTVTVSGTCTEAVIIDGFDGLTLAGAPGASINDPTPGVTDDNDVIDITGSRKITVRDLTINGGFDGITCLFFSECHLLNLTIQGGLEGVAFARSSGSVGDNTVIQNNSNGMTVFRDSHVRIGPLFTTNGVTIQNNGNAIDGGSGIAVGDDSHVDIFQSTIQNHAFGDGVFIGTGSHVQLLGVSVTGSGGNGVSVGPSSVLRLLGGLGTNVITASVGHGIALDHLTYLQINGPRSITGNAAPDVNCTVSTAKTRGTGGGVTPNLGGGTTNCTEPAP